MGQQLNWTWRDFLKSDIPFLLKCDVIYMLLDWKTSRGARLEHWLAKRYHKQVIYEAKEQQKVAKLAALSI
jgi:hypothetical protein